LLPGFAISSSRAKRANPDTVLLTLDRFVAAHFALFSLKCFAKFYRRLQRLFGVYREW
jgi:hypothetical protein